MLLLQAIKEYLKDNYPDWHMIPSQLHHNTYTIHRDIDTNYLTTIYIKTTPQHIAHSTQVGWDTYTENTVLTQITQLINKNQPL